MRKEEVEEDDGRMRWAAVQLGLRPEMTLRQAGVSDKN